MDRIISYDNSAFNFLFGFSVVGVVVWIIIIILLIRLILLGIKALKIYIKKNSWSYFIICLEKVKIIFPKKYLRLSRESKRFIYKADTREIG